MRVLTAILYSLEAIGKNCIDLLAYARHLVKLTEILIFSITGICLCFYSLSVGISLSLHV